MTEMAPEPEQAGASDDYVRQPAAPATPTATYVVVGPQRVHGVRRGGTLALDPEAPNTQRLVRGGHIRPVDGADNQEDD